MVPPTLLTRMSMRPKWLTAASIALQAPAYCSRSTLMVCTSTAPAASASSATSLTISERSTSSRLAFSAAICRATARPIPCAAPVTTTTLFSKRSARMALPLLARSKLFIVEAGRLNALFLHVTVHRFYHRRRTAEVDIHIAVMQMTGFHMVGDIAFLRPAALFRGDAGAEAEVVDGRGKGFQLVHLDQIGVVGDAVDQMDRVLAAILLNLLQHRQEGCQTGTASQHQHRTLDIAQVEAAERTAQGNAVIDTGLFSHIGTHQAFWYNTDQERDRLVSLVDHGTEGVGTGLVGTRHLHVDVLPRQKVHGAHLITGNSERQGGIRQAIDIGQFGMHIRLLAAHTDFG